MGQIRQADIARELGISEMSVHRLRKAMHIGDQAISDHACAMIFTAAELQRAGLVTNRACELASRFSEEIRYVHGDLSRRAWLIFIECTKYDIILPALTGRHLQAVIDVHPMSIVMALHEFVARASERVAAMKTNIARKEAA